MGQAERTVLPRAERTIPSNVLRSRGSRTGRMGSATLPRSATEVCGTPSAVLRNVWRPGGVFIPDRVGHETGGVRIAALLGVLLTLLAGCAIFNEPSLDMVVYFDNTTDQALQLRLKNPQPDEDKDWYQEIGPNERVVHQLLPRDHCGDRWVITDKAGNLVKDPGRICWHDTVKIL